MNQTLKNKVSNLVNVNRRDSAIFSPYNSTHISLGNYAKLSDIEDFFNGASDKIELNLDFNLDEILVVLDKATTVNEIVEIANAFSINIPQTRWNKLIANFEENKKEITELIIRTLQNLKMKFESISRRAKEHLKNVGSWNLYLTRYFIKGITPSRKVSIKAPLEFVQVELKQDGNSLTIYKKEEREPNEKIIIFLQREMNVKAESFASYGKIDYEVSYTKDIIEKLLNCKVPYLEKSDKPHYKNEKSSDIEKEYDSLVISDEIAFGIYEPNGGKLKEDLESIINMNEHNQIFETFPTTSKDQVELEEINEEHIIQIDKLDYYQRLAVRASLKDNTIIQGPPGTGKSEVISNIIANILYNNKNILMASEKAAALNVLQKRLKELSIFMLHIHETNDKKLFYESILELSEFLGNGWFNSNLGDSYNLTSNNLINESKSTAAEFKEFIKKLDDLAQHKSSNSNFLEFSKIVNRVGGIDVFKQFIESKFIMRIHDIAYEYNLSVETVIKKLDDLEEFIIDKQIKSNKEYYAFVQEVSKLKTAFDLDNISLNDIDDYTEKTIRETYPILEGLLKSKYNYQKMLKDNPFKFFQDVETFKEFKNATWGLINNSFFDQVNQSIYSFKPFWNVYSISKESDKKFILKHFAKTGQIKQKKSFIEMFQSSKLNNQEQLILNWFSAIDELNLEEYEDFNEIIKNQYIFSPLNILYYFDKNILEEDKRIFIKNNFDAFDFDLIWWKNRLELTPNDFSVFEEAVEDYQFYKKEFGEFLDSNTFFNYIEKYKNIKWENNCFVLAEMIRRNILNKLSKLSIEDKKMVKEAISVANLKRKRSIYQYLEKYAEALKFLFPIWVSRPEQVSIFVPLKKDYFDYGIYDEASQMFLERAYPLLFRSKINIVAGDDKQLKPSSFFVTREVENEEEDENIEDLDTQESLLDRAKTTSWTEILLQNHYRSENKDLIKFSSQYIYDDKLNFATKNSMFFKTGIDVINVNGFFVGNINKKEALEVIRLLNENYDKYENILVVAFNVTQAEYIKILITSSSSTDAEVVNKYNEEKIEILNLENVQGNEADLVILSVSYAKKAEGERLYNRFGPINQDGGKNRLNVAITRAKSKMIVIKSFSSTDMSGVNENNQNAMVFKNFISYLDILENNKDNDLLLNSKNHHFDSDFEVDVFEAIKPGVIANNWKILTQFEVGKKRIDIAITTSDYKRVILGIEVDGWLYHSGAAKRLEDFERQLFLEARGYNIFRVLEHEWKMDKNRVVERILEEAQRLEALQKK